MKSQLKTKNQDVILDKHHDDKSQKGLAEKGQEGLKKIMKKSELLKKFAAGMMSAAMVVTSIDGSALSVTAEEVTLGEESEAATEVPSSEATESAGAEDVTEEAATEEIVSDEVAEEAEETENEETTEEPAPTAVEAEAVTSTGDTEDATGVVTDTTTDFAILSTTDMHGKCWDKNVLNDTSVKNSMLRVSSAVNSIRTEYGEDNVVLLDNGDTFQGTPVSAYSLTNAGESFDGITPMAICMKYLEYDAFTLGNHEFNYKWSTMDQVYDYLRNSDDVNKDGDADNVEVMAANLVWSANNENVFETSEGTAYITREIKVGDDTLKVGILGLENTDCPRWDIADNYPGINFAHTQNTTYDMVDEVNTYVPEMKAAGCEYIIVSYHSGIGTNDNSDLVFGTNTENQAARIIAKTADIDMMILGHDHSTSYSNSEYTNKDGENVLVVNGGGSQLTETVLTATTDGKGNITVGEKSTKNVDLSTYEDDAALKTMIQEYADQASTYVNTPSGSLGAGDWDKITDSTSCYLGQTDTMDLINRAQILQGEKHLAEKYSTTEAKEAVKEAKNFTSADDVCDIDFSATSVVLNSGYTGLKAGEISIKDIYQFYKYDNSLYVLPLTGQQILDCLEYVAANRYEATTKKGEVSYKTINDYFTCPIFYGLDFTYDMSKEAGSRVTITGFKNGKVFDLARTYNLAINNYHLSNGPFAAYKTTDTIWSQTDDMGGGSVQDLIAEFVKANGEDGESIKPDRSNWKLTYTGEIPADEEPEAKKALDIYDPIPDATFATDYPDAVTIADAAEKTTGTGTVVGQVVYQYGGVNTIIEDVINGQVYGYLIYGKGDYTIGDVITVTGSFTTYSGIPEIKPADAGVKVIKSLGTASMIQPQVVTVSDLTNQTEGEYLNETVVIQNVPASNSTVASGEDSISIYQGASLPSGLAVGAAADIYGVCSAYYETYQLRNGSSDDYVAHTGTYDPVSDDMFTDGVSTIAAAKAAETGSAVTILGQVVTKIGAADESNKNNIVLQDVISGEVEGIIVYDKDLANTWYDGDVVKVTGTIGAYGGVPQITPTSMERVKTEVAFQPQVVTVAEASTEKYVPEYVTIKDVTLGTYNASGSTSAKDATGETNIYKGSAFPTGVAAGDVVDLTAVASKYNTNYQLRVVSSYDYVKSASSTDTEDPSLVKIPVVETTDVHGFLVDVSSGDEAKYQYRMAYIADQLNELRENSDVVLLDGGDIYQGNPVSNLLQGESMVAAYDLMDYDAVALGNHEFDWDVKSVVDSDGTMGSYSLGSGSNAVSGNSDIPVVCANMYYADSTEQKGTRVNFTKDYVIVEKTGVAADGTKETYKIAIFGYVDDYSSDIMTAKIEPYSIHEEDLEKVEATAAELEAAGKADASILLAHASASGVAGELASKTAIDLVCGGHTHVNATGTAKNGVAYVQAKNQAQAYSYAELCFDKEGNVSVANAENVNVTADKTALYKTEANADKLDQKIVNVSDLAVAEVAPIMNEELGTITEQVTKAAIGSNTYSSVAGTWMCELMNLATGADVSFTNNGGIRTEFTFEGDSKLMTAGDVYTIAPFCNTLPTFDMSYEKLKEVIEYAVSSDATSLALRMGGATAYYDNTGVVTTMFVGSTKVYENGQWVADKDTTVTVSTNEYIATAAGTPFAKMTSNETTKGETPVTDNESFIAALKKEGALNNGALFVNTSATLVAGDWDGATQPTVRPELEDTYTITFDANGSNVTGTMSDLYVGMDARFTLAKNAYTRKGYTFAGWSTKKTGSAVYADQATLSKLATKADETVTLYACWTANTYKVSFNANSSKATGKMSTISMTYDKAKTLTANAFKRTGYTFAGWSTSKTGSVKYANKASVKNLTSKNGKTVTLYAQWKANTYKVSFYKNSSKATGKMSAQTMAYGTAKKLTANSYKLAGYTFAGWSTSKNGKVKYADKASVKSLTTKADATIKLYAQWTKVSVKKVSISSVKSSKSKQFTVKWGKVSGADGYIVSYTTDKNFKSGVTKVAITKGSTTSTTIKGLKAGKKYYVKVRAYEKDSTGKKIAGKCNAIKSVKVK